MQHASELNFHCSFVPEEALHDGLQFCHYAVPPQ